MNVGARSSPIEKSVAMTEESERKSSAKPTEEEERKLLEKDRSFRLVCRRYARMRSRAAK